MPKFDLVIMNPPYARSLHLEILEKVIPEAEEVINISPIRWLQDPLATHKPNSDYYKFEDTILKKLEAIEVISSVSSIEKFGSNKEQCRTMVDLAIYKINKGGFNYEAYSRDTIVEKCLKFNTIKFEHNKKDGYRVRINTVAGRESGYSKHYLRTGKLLCFYNGEKDGKKWWQYWQTNQYSKHTDEITTSIKFNSEEEAENFIQTYNNSKLVDYVLCKTVPGAQTLGGVFIDTGDWTKSWTDDELCQLIGISDEEMKKVCEYVSRFK